MGEGKVYSICPFHQLWHTGKEGLTFPPAWRATKVTNRINTQGTQVAFSAPRNATSADKNRTRRALFTDIHESYPTFNWRENSWQIGLGSSNPCWGVLTRSRKRSKRLSTPAWMLSHQITYVIENIGKSNASHGE